MKNKIAFVLMCALSAGCMQEYPEKPGNENDKACNLVAYQSTISVQYRASSIPAKLSASVNGMPVVNECTLGSDNDSYLTVRNGDTATVLLRVGGNAALMEMFFNDDGSPKSGAQFQFILSGRENCGESAGRLYTTVRTLDWKPVYSNSNTACGPSGYMATVSN
jgi:hypothetical protein